MQTRNVDSCRALRSRSGGAPIHLTALLLASALAVPLLFLAGCSRQEPEVLGSFDESTPTLRIQAVEEQADELLTRDRIAVEGMVSEVCPTAGYWLVLQDGSRSLRVELLGFSVRRDHEGQGCRLEGKLVRKAGTVTLLARGARFEE